MNKVTVFSTVFALTIVCTLPSLAALDKKDPCLKNNNGIGNNHDVFVELPIHSLSLGDVENEILSIRIDPGNSGQVKKFKEQLAQQEFDNLEINFVIDQLVDAEIKLKKTKLQCLDRDYPVDIDYSLNSLFVD